MPIKVESYKNWENLDPIKSPFFYNSEGGKISVDPTVSRKIKSDLEEILDFLKSQNQRVEVLDALIPEMFYTNKSPKNLGVFVEVDFLDSSNPTESADSLFSDCRLDFKVGEKKKIKGIPIHLNFIYPKDKVSIGRSYSVKDEEWINQKGSSDLISSKLENDFYLDINRLYRKINLKDLSPNKKNQVTEKANCLLGDLVLFSSSAGEESKVFKLIYKNLLDGGYIDKLFDIVAKS